MLIAQRPTLSEEVVGDDRSRFTIEPLEPGFGYTSATRCGVPSCRPSRARP